MLISLGLQGVNMAVAPMLSRLYSLGKLKELQKVITLSSWVIMLIALPATLIFYLFGDQILSVVFGSDYIVGHQALCILAFGQFVNASVGLVGSLLVMTGNEKASIKALILAFITNMILNSILIPDYGMNGAAFSSAASLLFWNLYMWFIAKNRLNIQTCAIVTAIKSSTLKMRGA